MLDAMVRVAGASHVVVLLPERRSLGAPVEIGLTTAQLFGEGSIAAKVFASVEKKKGLKRAIVPRRSSPSGNTLTARTSCAVEFATPNGQTRTMTGNLSCR